MKEVAVMLTRSLLQPDRCNVRRARYPEMDQVASASVAAAGRWLAFGDDVPYNASLMSTSRCRHAPPPASAASAALAVALRRPRSIIHRSTIAARPAAISNIDDTWPHRSQTDRVADRCHRAAEVISIAAVLNTAM